MVKLEVIEQLKKQASSYASTKSKEAEEWQWIYENKFAELIVLECADWIDEQDESRCPWSRDLIRHFGVKA